MRLYCTKCEKKRDMTFLPSMLRPSDQPGGDQEWCCDTCHSTVSVPTINTATLIEMPFDEARALKFAVGRAEHGPVFLNNPISEIFLELVDGVNYAEEALRQGFDSVRVKDIIDDLTKVAGKVQELYRR